MSTPEPFLQALRQSGLLAPEQLEAHASPRGGEDAGRLADRLVAEGLLTPFQARALLRGEWRGLLVGGKYKVLDQLGITGTGRVFLCEHVRMRRRVALKVLPAELTGDREAIQRFYSEARAIAALDHPNIVRAYDADCDGDLHFLVLEYIEGVSLKTLVQTRGRLPVAQAVHYVAQTACGLQHAHEAGWVHRDIKPENLFLDRGGTVKVLDLGMALLFKEDRGALSATPAGEAARGGKVDYEAPEQATGEGVDIRADIYSLGATFYYLLAGQPPFPSGSLADKRLSHRTREPTPIREWRRDVPPELAGVLHRMMAKDPAQRYATPGEVAQALLPWTQPLSRPVTLTEFFLPSGVPANPFDSKPVTRRVPALEADEPVTAPVPEAFRSGPPPAPAAEELPDELVHTPIPLLTHPSGLHRRPAVPAADAPVPPRGSGVRPRLHAPRTPGSGERPRRAAALRGHAGPVLSLCFSSDDGFLASGGQDASVRLWQLGHETRERGALHDPRLGEVQALAFAPGQLCLVTGCASLEGAMWRCRWGASGQESTPIPEAPAFSDALCFSPSGRLLASAVSSQVLVWGVAGGVFRRRAVLKGHEGDVKSLCFSPDGRVLACGEDGAIHFWRIGWLWTAQDRPLAAHPGGVTSLAYSPDGELLASGGLDRAVRVWRVRSRAAVAVFEGLAGAVRQLRFVAGGRQLVGAAEGGEVALWDLEGRERQRAWQLDLPRVRAVGLSGGGRWAAAGSEDGSVAVYDLGLGPAGAPAPALAGTAR